MPASAGMTSAYGTLPEIAIAMELHTVRQREMSRKTATLAGRSITIEGTGGPSVSKRSAMSRTAD